ncbi:MAG TPA: hypothetical protein VEV87_05035 [Chitinophagaceae bacterium]|nr:hypothetical protein [Chitinophagaceae bacterium]
MITVTFEIYLNKNNETLNLTEAMLFSELEKYKESVLQREVVDGAIVITATEQEKLIVSDELWAAVQNLCFESIPVILDEKRETFLYRYTSYDGHLIMIPLGNMIRFTGENIPMITVPSKELFPALYECGKRFISFLSKLEGVESEMVKYLGPFKESAKNSLIRHQMLPVTGA